MNMYRDGYSSTFSAIYFLVLVGFGAFFMINLFFAVMWEQFSAIADIESRKVRAERCLSSGPLCIRDSKLTWSCVDAASE